MSLPTDARFHFRCSFRIHARNQNEPIWCEVVRLIRGWIERREDNSAGLHSSWFFTGGRWSVPSPDLTINTEVGSGQQDAPEFWALRYDHPCSDAPSRRWRTDIGLTNRADGCVDLRLRLVHYLRPGFVGEEPEAPVVTSPLS